MRKHEINTGLRDDVPSEERDRIKAMEREVKELVRANEILRVAAQDFILSTENQNGFIQVAYGCLVLLFRAVYSVRYLLQYGRNGNHSVIEYDRHP